MYKRILLKLSGEALAGDGNCFDPKVLDRLAADIREIRNLGVEVAIVVGGGNFIRGKNLTEIGIERVQGDYMGMLATIINALALQSSFERNGLDTRVQTSIDITKVAEPFIVRRATRHLEKGRIVIFGGGTGSPDFSTDTTLLETVKAFIYMKVRMIFDPPASSVVADAFNSRIRELEWRLNVQAERNWKDNQNSEEQGI